MTKKSDFHEVSSKYLPTLQQYVPVVARVHGDTHPEFHVVKSLFEVIDFKIADAGTDKPDLDEEFAQLSNITDDYTIPDDVCESYEAVYNMLSEMDEAYQTYFG